MKCGGGLSPVASFSLSLYGVFMIALLCAYGALIIFLVLCSAQAVRPLVPSFCLVTVAALGAFGAVGVTGFILWLAFVCALTVVYHYHAVIVPPLKGELLAAEDARDVFKAHRDEQTAKVRDLRAAALDDAGDIAYLVGRRDYYATLHKLACLGMNRTNREHFATLEKLTKERDAAVRGRDCAVQVIKGHNATIADLHDQLIAVDLSQVVMAAGDVASELAYTVSQYQGILTALGHDAGILTSEGAANAVTRMETETAARTERLALLDLVRYSVPFLPCGRERNDAKRLTDVCTVIDVEFDDLPKGADASP